MAATKVRKKKASYFTPLVSVTLVLFLIGLFGMLVFYADQLKTYLKENIQVNVLFKEDAKEADIIRLQKLFDNEAFVKQTEYVTKEKARQIMIDELGEDAQDLLGFNPFPATLDIYFKAYFAKVDSIENFKSKIEKYPFVKEVAYQRIILENIDKNVRIGGIIILSFFTLFLLIMLVLINNTVRLTLYSKRFLIKSMQYVGATQGFIRRPFIFKAMTYGFFGGIIADILLAFIIYYVSTKIAYSITGNLLTNIVLAVSLPIFGVVITGVSSYYSVRKFLRTKLDDLY